MSTKEASAKWDISEHQIQILCEENHIDDVVRLSRVWTVPKDVQKPIEPEKTLSSANGGNN